MLFVCFVGQLLCMDSDVVHEHRSISFCHVQLEYCIHHHLECCWGVGKSEEHNCRFEQSLRGRNAAFHSSPGLIRILLYPQQTSNLVNRVHPASQSIMDGMRGDTL